MLATVTWLGGNGAWDEASNWDTHSVPSGADDVVIPKSSNNMLSVVSCNGASVHSLTLSDNSTLNLAGTLTLAKGGTIGGVINNSGTIVHQGGERLYFNVAVLNNYGVFELAGDDAQPPDPPTSLID